MMVLIMFYPFQANTCTLYAECCPLVYSVLQGPTKEILLFPYEDVPLWNTLTDRNLDIYIAMDVYK